MKMQVTCVSVMAAITMVMSVTSSAHARGVRLPPMDLFSTFQDVDLLPFGGE